jgi:septal ring factor EnvC (AmiA/AmiB activator)
MNANELEDYKIQQLEKNSDKNSDKIGKLEGSIVDIKIVLQKISNTLEKIEKVEENNKKLEDKIDKLDDKIVKVSIRQNQLIGGLLVIVFVVQIVAKIF